MTNYYIKITDEIPSDEDPSLWFQFNSTTNELLVLNKSEYETLTSNLNSAINNVTQFIEDNDEVKQAVRDIVEDGDFEFTNSVNSSNLVESGNTGNAYTYANLKSKLDSIDDSLDEKVNSTIFDTALSNQDSTNNNQNSRLDVLESISDGLAWKKTTMSYSIEGLIMQNRVFYNDYLVCLFLDTLPPHRGTGDWKQIVDFNISGNPTHLFPPYLVLENTTNESFRLTPDGQLYSKFTKGGLGYIKPLIFLMYPRKTILDL